ncbi:unnamed protein product, partial [Choristocarpus tenellus]
PLVGPAVGGTNVTVYGEGFRSEETYLCMFGDIAVPVLAGDINSSSISCMSPPSHYFRMGMVQLQLKHLGEGTGAAYFSYDEDVILRSLTPDRGAEAIETRVLIQGSGFRDSSHLACRFGLYVIPAVFINVSIIECTAPPKGRLRTMSVDVTLNGQDFASDENGSLVFSYSDQISVLALNPRLGSVRGGTNVQVLGMNFENHTELFCLFGVIQVPANFLSSEVITCNSPP